MNKLEHPVRILHIVSSMGRGGAESLIMNIYRMIDRSEIQFDFITHSKGEEDYDEEIKLMGGRIYPIASLGASGPINYMKSLVKIMSANNYAAIHAHTDYQSGFPALAAKLCGISTRICHSHSNNWLKNSSFKERFVLRGLQTMIKLSATKYCSCSEEAAKFLFGKKNVSKVQILKNGINVNEYTNIGTSSRIQVLEELHLPETAKLIGHVGRFSESKNHIFILKVLKKLLETDPSFIALLIGDGPLRKVIEEKAERMGLSENIKFLGVRTDIPRLMKSFDIFVFPSLFEGFGIVMLEAQSTGTPCIASTSVPKSTDMELGLVQYLDLGDNLDSWVDAVKETVKAKRPSKQAIINNFTKLGFNIYESINDWLGLYEMKGYDLRYGRGFT
ncbi:glycosyltransferase EpsF [Cytobacillus firmus]|uniref:Glycosyltransferase EpsF n=2 Tax=Cytobacillus TaxID=2675230 RepID=A0A366JL37_CYTFI|nr:MULTISPECIES: glycosyltransferase family 1 protein [Cytobacillus]RBP88281.1 glycosyltransferase EpsF [Cytobacillus firmus]TDX38354.1 glycosyltransferase EpsF [Cytobacillus oceanisediminis]